jgi:hypothetical protein
VCSCNTITSKIGLLLKSIHFKIFDIHQLKPPGSPKWLRIPHQAGLPMESTREQTHPTAACGKYPDADRKSGFVVLKHGMVWTRAFGKQRKSLAWEPMVSLGSGNTNERIQTYPSVWSSSKAEMTMEWDGNLGS